MRVVLFFLLLVFSVGGSGAQTVTGDWYGTLKVPGGKLRLVFHIQEKGGQYAATMDSPDQGARGIPATSVAYREPVLEIRFVSLGASWQGMYSGEQLEGTFTQGGMAFPLNLRREEEKSVRPQEPRPPFPYQAEEVSFTNAAAGITLAGTLTLPEGEGPFPAVVLISGSGPQNRDEEMMGHKPFLVLADALTRRGIAVLRFDDRGVGQSGGVHAAATTLDFAGDVAAAVEYLRTRREVRPAAIGLVGHSEGGIIAPVVAAADPEIAFAVLLAGVGVSGRELLLSQTEALLKAGNAPPEYIDKVDSINLKAYDIVLTSSEEQLRPLLDSLLRTAIPLLTMGQQLSPEQQEQFVGQRLNNLLSPWFRGFVAFRPEKYLKQVKCPVLALNGEKDLQVDARQNLPAIYRTLQQSGNRAVDTVYLPGLNHLFQHCTTGLPAEYASIGETFSPEVLEMVGDWIMKTVK